MTDKRSDNLLKEFFQLIDSSKKDQEVPLKNSLENDNPLLEHTQRQQIIHGVQCYKCMFKVDTLGSRNIGTK